MSASALSVLIVSAGSASELAAALRKGGHEVRVAGSSASDKAGRAEPDVILLDLAHPPADVYELARRLARPGWPQHPLLVAVGGPTDPAARGRAAAAGIELQLLGPPDESALSSLLARYAALLDLVGQQPAC
jgi:CheY-like chemotaxis protein